MSNIKLISELEKKFEERGKLGLPLFKDKSSTITDITVSYYWGDYPFDFSEWKDALKNMGFGIQKNPYLFESFYLIIFNHTDQVEYLLNRYVSEMNKFKSRASILALQNVISVLDKLQLHDCKSVTDSQISVKVERCILLNTKLHPFYEKMVRKNLAAKGIKADIFCNNWLIYR